MKRRKLEVNEYYFKQGNYACIKNKTKRKIKRRNQEFQDDEITKQITRG